MNTTDYSGFSLNGNTTTFLKKEHIPYTIEKARKGNSRINMHNTTKFFSFIYDEKKESTLTIIAFINLKE